MDILFYISAVIAVIATGMVVTRTNAVHALLYLIASLLAVAMVFLGLGAAFAAMLEVIVYAGAIMVLFIFVIMMLNLGKSAVLRERAWLEPGIWKGPALLCIVLAGELVWAFHGGGLHPAESAPQTPRMIGIALFGPYMLAVELASLLLLAGLVGAYHLGKPERKA